MSDASKPFFRSEALLHYGSAERNQSVVRICPPWIGVFGATGLAVVGVAIVIASFGAVDVTARGPGIVYPQGGVRALFTQSGGTVKNVDVHSGDRIAVGSEVLSIEAAELQSQTVLADAELADAQKEIPALVSRQKNALVQQVSHLELRAELLKTQIQSQESSVKGFEKKAEIAQVMNQLGATSGLDAMSAQELSRESKRQLASLKGALEQNAQELIALRTSQDRSVWQDNQSLRTSQTRRVALNSLHRQTSVISPESGIVEALLVKPGDVVQEHQLVGKLFPIRAALQVVAFLGERDRAFVKPGDTVRLELAELPYSQYGSLGGQVVRVSDDLVSPYQVEQALGQDTKLASPSFWVDIEITDPNALTLAKVPLRSGMLLDARFTLRRKRLLTLIFPPLQRWLH